MDDHDAGLERNAAAYTRCLTAVPGSTHGAPRNDRRHAARRSAAPSRSSPTLRELIGEAVRHRIGFCADTCHLYSAGHDLVGDFDGVWRRFEETIGFEHLRCIHLNDSKTPFSSRRDRHELIAEGSLGAEPFRRIMRDPRFAGVPKVLETPKGEDGVTEDRRMMRRLRAYARARACALTACRPAPIFHRCHDLSSCSRCSSPGRRPRSAPRPSITRASAPSARRICSTTRSSPS